jgi:membrane protease YdiL (CAAX protease family)
MSELILTEPLRGAPEAATAPPPPAPQRWGFWATSAWGLAMFAALYAAQIVIALGVIIWLAIDPASSPDIHALMSHAIMVSATTLGCVPVTLLAIALAVRLARVPFADYLALKPVGMKALLLALACTLGYGTVTSVVGYLAGFPTSPFAIELYRTARDTGTAPLMFLAVAIGAPLNEEFLFRGFLMRGWAVSRLGAVGAIVLTSAIWAAIHIQYDWFGVSEIFGLGLLLGYVRLRTGTLLVPLMMHAVYGIAAMGLVALFYG